METTLFEKKKFTMHSGDIGHWKIECDALTDSDWETLAFIISQKYKFRNVFGIPTGGTKLSEILKKYRSREGRINLIVDDVLTTGKSMEELKSNIMEALPIVGVVLFARGECPEWIKPIFQMWK